MTKEYKCICGKTYTNPQAFNGHKRHCKVHLEQVGKLDKIKMSDEKAIIKIAATHKKLAEEKRSNLLEQWISEKHICEKCGKVMTEKYGSGRFCSQSCAKGHAKSDIDRIKISETLRGRKLTEDEKVKLLSPKQSKCEVSYEGPDLPELQQEKLSPGFFPRTRMSYAEKFWKQVLDNNAVDYKHDFVVHKPRGERGVYRLDFLVDNFDIEIDGSQHYYKKDINIKDIRRDEYLESLGYIVYRIRWINPNNDENKIKVNQQIKDLFNFIDRPRFV